MISPACRLLLFSNIAIAAALPLSAQAQTKAPEFGPEKPDETATTPPTTTAPSADTKSLATEKPAPSNDEEARAALFRKFDALRSQGQTTDFPGVYQTLTQDAGGFRTWLYENDLYVRGVSTNTFTYDVAGGNYPKNPQRYVGQKLTASNTNDLRLSWKFGGSGEDITQLNVGVGFNFASWRQTGPSGARFTNLTLYSSFFDKAVEVKAGFSNNISDFVGLFAGGNPILANGIASSIPIATGMSGGTALTPTFNVQLNPGGGFYSKSAIQRSVLPAGLAAETDRAGAGLKLTQPGARPLFIQEFGIRRPAGPGERQLWLRAGGTYNLSRYRRLDGLGTERNWSLYALGDYQVYQPDAKRSYRGVYVGASVFLAPDAINTYTRTFDGRVYALGMVPGRPLDQMTLSIGSNRFSRRGGEAIAATGQVTHRNQFSIGALYAVHVMNGLFMSPSVTYIKNPSFVGDFDSALNLGFNATVLF